MLSGPSFAQEVAHGPADRAGRRQRARRACATRWSRPSTARRLRVYANDDIVGVEVGGAVKNVLAIATGLCDGLQLGLNARAALITRGLAEMTRLGVALGARADTFMGLSGLGDLVLTATGDLSPQPPGRPAAGAGPARWRRRCDSLGHVAEGVYCARTVVQRARRLGVEMPIAEGVVALLDGHVRPGAGGGGADGPRPRFRIRLTRRRGRRRLRRPPAVCSGRTRLVTAALAR